MSQLSQELSDMGFGPLNAFCMMLFCLLYTPCAATLATVKKETGSTGKMVQTAIFQIVVAWAVTFGVYQIASLFLF